MKKYIQKIAIFAGIFLLQVSCVNEDLLNNPNAIATDGPVSASGLINHLTSKLVAKTDNTNEYPFKDAAKINQFIVSNDSYYWGSNSYNWGNTGSHNDLLVYANALQNQVDKTTDENDKNYYAALAKFFKVYYFIWTSQRVGDTPMTQAGNENILKPEYDSQRDLYSNCLNLLEEINSHMNKIPSETKNSKVSSGDIFSLTYLQWQKVINSFYIRTLISLSKRANDTSELEVKERFIKILNNPETYPLQQSNSDNMVYVFNIGANPYPIYEKRGATGGINIAKTILSLTTKSQDPRTYAFATPAPEKYNTEGISFSSFDAYVGVSSNLAASEISNGTDSSGSTSTDKGSYSYINYKRYFATQNGSTAEPYIVIGYPELSFNIAEAINRGWISGDAEQWYKNGINSSLEIYGIKNGEKYSIGDRLGNTLGEVTINVDQFLNNSNVVYKGNNEQGLEQIIDQKYIAFFCNSGYEAYYNWRRTGYPKFEEGGVGIGTPTNKIPYRWKYPQGEISYNAENYQKAISKQFASDDVFEKMWLIK